MKNLISFLTEMEESARIGHIEPCKKVLALSQIAFILLGELEGISMENIERTREWMKIQKILANVK